MTNKQDGANIGETVETELKKYGVWDLFKKKFSSNRSTSKSNDDDLKNENGVAEQTANNSLDSFFDKVLTYDGRGTFARKGKVVDLNRLYETDYLVELKPNETDVVRYNIITYINAKSNVDWALGLLPSLDKFMEYIIEENKTSGEIINELRERFDPDYLNIKQYTNQKLTVEFEMNQGKVLKFNQPTIYKEN